MVMLPLIGWFVIIMNANGCKKPTSGSVDTTSPYPSLSEQRTLLSNKPQVIPTRILDSSQIIDDLEFLASDACEGRKPGTKGHSLAMERILMRLRTARVDSFDQSMIQVFDASTNSPGKNIVGYVKGTSFTDQYIVVSAHYDHIGKTATGDIFYGADDNASGVACMLALATYFKKNPHPYSLIFAAFDKEESGLVGARQFVQFYENKSRLEALKFNLNMDMIARSDNNEIFASGIAHNPTYKKVIEAVQTKTNVKLLMGHDGVSPEADWTSQSDHYAFHARKIPFIYIGVEDHPDYHKTTDTFNKINYARYIEICNMIALMVQTLRP